MALTAVSGREVQSLRLQQPLDLSMLDPSLSTMNAQTASPHQGMTGAPPCAKSGHASTSHGREAMATTAEMTAGTISSASPAHPAGVPRRIGASTGVASGRNDLTTAPGCGSISPLPQIPLRRTSTARARGS